jgi:hypothetical protein
LVNGGIKWDSHGIEGDTRGIDKVGCGIELVNGGIKWDSHGIEVDARGIEAAVAESIRSGTELSWQMAELYALWANPCSSGYVE